MKKMANKNNNTKSLFLYTALIFLVALLLIVIAFFGEANLEKSIDGAISTAEPMKQDNKNNSITKRAATLSDENQKLLSENKAIKTENEELKAQLDLYKILLEAKTLKQNGDVEGAKKLIENIDYEQLDSAQKSVYNEINEE